jgi:hypothetical protein
MPSTNPEVLARAQKNWRKKNPNYLKEWRAKNPEKNLEYGKAAYERRKEQYRAYYHRNKERMLAYGKMRRAMFPEIQYATQLKKRCGLTLAEKRAMWEQQSHKCKICSRPITFQGSHPDHIHGSNPVIVRGLLCGSCNRALGLFQDSSAILETAAAYLRLFSM